VVAQVPIGETLMEIEAEPVTNHELGRLFQGLERFRRIILAVSGGADSMALMHLVVGWAQGLEGETPAIEVVTVDHGLRPRSAEEAAWVEARARALGLAHTTLVWSEKKPRAGIQEAAREARYRLLAEYVLGSRAGRPAAVVTAHTEDDQAETLLMRLARGSGIDGLSAMPARRPLADEADVEIVRPLLAMPKTRLLATLKARALDWVEDPSNDCLDYERVRLRAAKSELAALGLANDKLALSARRLARAREALDVATSDLVLAAVDSHEGVFASIDRAAFLAAAPELRVRVLMRVLKAFGGGAKAPRLVKVESLAEELGGHEKVALTLGGCLIRARAKDISVFREQDRYDLPQIQLEPGSGAIWDRRFRVSLGSARKLAAAGVKQPVMVRALGAGAYATLRARLAPAGRPPSQAAATLPSFWAGEELIAVPQLGPADRALKGSSKRGHGLCRAEFIGWELFGERVAGLH
jgi:tRNA(Ile)-lysidine synthase